MKYALSLSRLALLTAGLLLASILANANPCAGDCPTPMGLAVVSLSNSSVRLSWKAVSSATGYTIEVEQEPSGSGLNLDLSLSDTLYVLHNLQAGVQYKFKVRSRCGSDKSDWSAWMFFTTLGGGSGGSCPTPAQLSSSNITETTAILTWSSVLGALLYNLEVESEPSHVSAEIKVSISDTVFALSALKPGTVYKAKVRADCGSGKSDWSPWIAFQTAGSGNGSGGCAVPSNIVVTVQDSMAFITWGAISGAIAYAVEIEAKPGGLKWKDTVLVNEYTFKSLKASTLYKVKVRALCAGGTVGMWSKEIYFSSGGVIPAGGSGFLLCVMPTQLQVSSLSSTSAVLSWGAIVGAEGYQIEIERQPSVKGEEFKIFSPTNSYTVTGLEPGRTYKFKVRTLCPKSGRSKWSPYYIFQTPPAFNDVENRNRVLAEEDKMPLAIALSPNPVVSTARLQIHGLRHEEPLRLALYDLSGRMAWQTDLLPEATRMEIMLPLQTLSPGLYLLQAGQSGSMITHKIVISH